MLGQRRTRALVWVVGTAIAPIGCLLTNSFDGIAGVRPEDSGPDTTTEDGPILEAGPEDAGADRPPIPFCATQTVRHTLCLDFDEGGVTSGGFARTVGPNASVTQDTMQFVSAPNSMRAATIRVPDSASKLSAILSRDLRLKPQAFKVEFDIRIGTCQSTGGPITLFVVAPTATDVYGFLITGSNVFTFSEQHALPEGGAGPKQSYSLPNLDPDTWSRVSMNVTFAGDGGTLNVRVNGSEFVSSPLIVGIIPDGQLLINFGANATGPTDPCVVFYDNVTIDVDKVDGGL